MAEVLYMAVTCDEYELPLFVTDDLEDLAAWAGVRIKFAKGMISRNDKKEPFKPKRQTSKHRLRRLLIEEEDK